MISRKLEHWIAVSMLLLALTFGFPHLLFANAVDNLRGQWLVTVNVLGPMPEELAVYINDLQPGPNSLVATGCMKSSSGALAPLSMQAQRTGGDAYFVTMVSTVIPESGNPFVIRLMGPIETFGDGVTDDAGGGTGSKVETPFVSEGEWSAVHHDRRRTDCPAVQIPPLNFSADVMEQRNLFAGQLNQVKTNFSGMTDIVSAGMRVDRPDGTSVVVPPFTDIFSPNVDFVTQFR